eukprot:g2189.t1
MREMMDSQNVSIIYKHEFLNPGHSTRPFYYLEKAIHKALGFQNSIHLYASARGARVLSPHTDPYDVIVYQLFGHKLWRACIPDTERLDISLQMNRNLTNADLCQLQEIAKHNIAGCSTYTVEGASTFECIDFELVPGDFLYMPKGVVHYAITNSDDDYAAHITIGLRRNGMKWIDVAAYTLTYEGYPYTFESLGHEFTPTLDLLLKYSEKAEGIHLQDIVPPWLLNCIGERLHNKLYSSECSHTFQFDQKRMTVAERNLEQLFELWERHVELFASWLWNSRMNILSAADKDWWSIDLKVPKRMTNESAVIEAFEMVSKIKEVRDEYKKYDPELKETARNLQFAKYKIKEGKNNFVRRNWINRTASNREVYTRFSETLCDRMRGLAIECIGSEYNICIGMVDRKNRISKARRIDENLILRELAPEFGSEAEKYISVNGQNNYYDTSTEKFNCNLFCAMQGFQCRGATANIGKEEQCPDPTSEDLFTIDNCKNYALYDDVEAVDAKNYRYYCVCVPIPGTPKYPVTPFSKLDERYFDSLENTVISSGDKKSKVEVSEWREKNRIKNSLCESIFGWEIECIGSTKHQCHAYIELNQKVIDNSTGKKRTCRSFCQNQGLYCTGGWNPLNESCDRDFEDKYAVNQLGDCDAPFSASGDFFIYDDVDGESYSMSILHRICLCELQDPDRPIFRSWDIDN